MGNIDSRLTNMTYYCSCSQESTNTCRTKAGHR